jgi:hypothetical protein
MFPLDLMGNARVIALRRTLAMLGLRYTLLLLIIPAYVLALSRRRWTTVPLWLVSTAVMLTQFMLSAQQNVIFSDWPQPSAFAYVGEMTKIMLIPIAVQFAVVLSGYGNSRWKSSKGPRKLIEALDATQP